MCEVKVVRASGKGEMRAELWKHRMSTGRQRKGGKPRPLWGGGKGTRRPRQAGMPGNDELWETALRIFVNHYEIRDDGCKRYLKT